MLGTSKKPTPFHTATTATCTGTHQRKVLRDVHASPSYNGSPDEVVLDANALAVGKKFSQVGSLEVSPGGSRAAYLHDTTALRVYTLYVKDLATGKLLGDSISRVVPSIAWANDTVFFYQTADSARRSDAVWRHVLGTPRSSDVEVFHENDVLDNVGVGRSKSNKFIVISDDGFTSSESASFPPPILSRLRSSSPRRASVSTSRSYRWLLSDDHQRQRAKLQGDAHCRERSARASGASSSRLRLGLHRVSGAVQEQSRRRPAFRRIAAAACDGSQDPPRSFLYVP